MVACFLNPVKFSFKSAAILPLLLLVGGCASDDNKKEIPHPIGRGVTRTSGEANTYTVNDDDQQMGTAVRRARRNVGQFIAAVKNPPSNTRDFQVKKLFIAPDGTAEHIWLADVQFTGNRFVGVVDNRPEKIAGLKLGAKASVNPDEVTDWSYVENGRLVGGYTIRMLYAEMNDEEKQQFEKQADFRIDN